MSRRKSRRQGSSTLKWLIIIGLIVLVGYFVYRELGIGINVEPGSNGPVIKIDVPTIDLKLPTPVASAPSPGGATAPSPAPEGWYDIYFTTPRYPDKPAYHNGGLDTQLVAFINTAQQTVDIAAYDFDLENVANALAEAAARGVRVRMVTDSDTLDRALGRQSLLPQSLTSGNDRELLNSLAAISKSDTPLIKKAIAIIKRAKIPIIGDERPALMHNKFVIVDSREVWTGACNFTAGDTYRLNNNAIKIVSRQLAQNYTIEFEKMFVQRSFGSSKSAGGTEPLVTLQGVRIENYFAPEDRVADKIIVRLDQAQQSIHFLAFSFTSDPIGSAMLARAQAGVSVAGVFEKTGSETQYSEYGRLRQAGLDVLQDGNPYVMHHKVIIIDGRTVIFGSFNFSNNADKDNDENLLIIDDPTLAQAFEAEFQRVREVALNPLKK
ncbi:MAG: phospholipase D-like domain-containing protein [Chloroflexota bacterium]|nr:phospholipase D-like domain-containing protein [Chloroflexota bacterium]